MPHPCSLVFAAAMLLAGLLDAACDAAAPARVLPDVEARFQHHHFKHAGRTLAYRLYDPYTQSCAPSSGHLTSRALPLLIWFHGRGESGDNQSDQLAWLELILGSGDGRQEFPAWILAPQFPRGTPPWVARASSYEEDKATADPLRDVDAMLAHVLAHQPVDTRRISLAGISQGATAAWEYARRHPGRFAALLSLATTDTRRLTAPGKPAPAVWAVQSTADGNPLLARVGQRLTELRQSGRPTRWTVIDAPDHDCWTAALREHRAHRWLIQQRLPADPDDRPTAMHSVVLVGAGLAGTLLLLRMMALVRNGQRVRRAAE